MPKVSEIFGGARCAHAPGGRKFTFPKNNGPGCRIYSKRRECSAWPMMILTLLALLRRAATNG
jgi:hypothetical protein